MSETQRAVNNVVRLLLIMMAVVLGLALFVPTTVLNLVITIFTSAIAGAIISVPVTALVEASTGDALKGYLIEFELYGINFSFTLFFIATLIVRLWLFH